MKSFNISCLFVFLIVFNSENTSLFAQISWPAVNQQTKPWTRWWWQGSAVDTTNIRILLNIYKDAGLGGLEITPIYGVKGTESHFVTYLSNQWVDLLLYTLREAKRLNLGMDMATGTGWPFGGPWVSERDASKFIIWKTYSLKDGESLPDTIQYNQEGFVRTANGKQLQLDQILYPVTRNSNLQELAIDQVRYNAQLPFKLLMGYDDKGKNIDLTSKVQRGKLNWVAPAGNWKLIALFEGLHGKMVERSAPGGEGNVIDHFDLQALRNYFSKFDKALMGKDISGLRSFFNDSYEVDDARGQSNWTPGFFREFRKRRGYDLATVLPSLIATDSSITHKQVLYDYRNTISELLLDNFTKPWNDWASGKGKMVRNQSHGSPANILDLYAAVDIPETEGVNLTRFKFATSAAHVMGKPLASAEASTWLNDHFLSTLGDVKNNIDQYFLGGVNHIFYHGTNYSPVNEPWPGWLFYAAVHFTPSNPFWKDFGALNDYVTKCQSFLQSGKSSSDVLLYFPFHDRNYETAKGGLLHHFDGMEGFENTDFNRSAELMQTKGYCWDLISDRQIGQLKVSSNSLIAPGGKYQTIVLSGVHYIPYSSLLKLTSLVKGGATLIVQGSMPSEVPGYKDAKNYQRLFDSLLRSFRFESIQQSMQIAKIGRGKILLGNNLDELLRAANVRQEEDLSAKQISYVRRSIQGGEYYFLVNNSNTKLDEWIELNTEFKAAYLFKPMQTESGMAKYKRSAIGKPSILLQLSPGESCIVQTSREYQTAPLFPYTEMAGEPSALKGQWKLHFINGGEVIPGDTVLKELVSWTAFDNDAATKFSGSASYIYLFTRPELASDGWRLDLGDVRESVEIILNGKKLSTLLGPDYSINIPSSLLKDINELKLIVTNGMANRMIDFEKRGVVWKKFYNINMPAKLAVNRGADGLFTTTGWKPFKSGLLGPVTLTPFNYLKN